MKRIITFIMLVWAFLTMAHAQDYIVNAAPNTVQEIVDGKTRRPIKQGQKLNIKAKVDFYANATLELLSIDDKKRYVINANTGAYALEKLIKKANGIDLSMDYLRYLMKELLKRTSATEGDGKAVGGISRDGEEDMFDIQDWLDNDSISNDMSIPDTNIIK